MFLRRLCSRKSALIAFLCAAASAAGEARTASAGMSIEAVVVHSLSAEQQDGSLMVRTSTNALLVADEGVSVTGDEGTWAATATGQSERLYLTIVYY